MKERDKRFPGCPKSLEDHIERSANKGFLYFANQNRRIFQVFRRVTGEEYASSLSPYGYFMGTIYVRTESPAYVERFNYMKIEWMKAINIEMGMEIITEMRIKVLPPGEDPPEVDGSPEYQALSKEAGRNSIDRPE
jgi:hypothetical protein